MCKNSQHMHYNKPIMPFKPLSHHPPAVHQINHQTESWWWVYAAVWGLWYCCCSSDVVRQWISLHANTMVPKLTSAGPLMKAPFFSSGNWIFTLVSCLLRSKAFQRGRLSSHARHTNHQLLIKRSSSREAPAALLLLTQEQRRSRGSSTEWRLSPALETKMCLLDTGRLLESMCRKPGGSFQVRNSSHLPK